LRIPVAVIADLDFVTDPDRLQRVVSTLATNAEIKRVREEARQVSSAIKSLPPTISSDEVKRLLAAAAAFDMDWSKNQDAPLREALQTLAQNLDRMRRLKHGGIASLPGDVGAQASALIERLAQVGVFVVPVGELEEWLTSLGIEASKRNKWAWASEAAAKVRKAGAQSGDVWDFTRTVARFLTTALESDRRP